MKVKLLTSVGIKGKSHDKGATVEADKELAAKLILSNKAVAVKAKKKTEK